MTTSSPNFDGLHLWGDLTEIEQEVVIKLVNHLAVYSDYFANDPDMPSDRREWIVKDVIELVYASTPAWKQTFASPSKEDNS